MKCAALLGLTVLGSSGLLLPAAVRADAVEPKTDAAATATAAAPKVDEAILEQIKEVTKDGLFVETFEQEETFDGKRWFKSTHEKYTSQEVSLDEYTVETGHVVPEKGLVLDKPAKHYGLAVKLDEPLQIDGTPGKKEMVVQYEVKLKKGLTCGGAYVKLLRQLESGKYSDFSDSTPFVIMFGPDKCGSSDKVHFIFQHKNPVTGKYEEKHMESPPQIKSDRHTHIYTLVVRDDNTYEMFIDQNSVSSGSLYEKFSPAVIPEKEIEDENDKKPSDWVDEARIPDPDAKKPEDWDEDAPARIPDEEATKPAGWLDEEPTTINDPSVEKPEDWDDEDDGEWVAPQVPNPKCEKVSGCGEWERPTKANPAYKGKWKAPLIPNPAYKGEWEPRKIKNPAYFEDAHPARMDPIGALAIEVWTMSEGITFDNFWLGNDLKKAQEFANLTWAPKHAKEVEEQEKTREKEKQEAADRKARESGMFSKMQLMATDFVEFAKENPLIGLGSVLLVSLALIFGVFMICCGKGDEGIQEKADSGEEEEEEEIADDVVDEKKAAVSEDGEQKVRQRKKAPKV
ncbi:TPA: hypothetical protein N0F65_004459 [Lagenidium giganteum]|uniref:Calnexin n=1 Tax=Lagenidium giganteum TaxID=4803 RepID=A0AAV2ZDP7_9STRA|nr:TPA: hypothetical protein N0F65_004459 [Lagenidium giganteum]